VLGGAGGETKRGMCVRSGDGFRLRGWRHMRTV
jgi:hypothetical protein